MINILIRTHERPAMFKRCIDSILNQAFPGYPMPIAIYVACDTERSYEYAIKTMKGCGVNHLVFKVQRYSNSDFHYNLFCNNLIRMADAGAWLWFVDDDDYLVPGALDKIDEAIGKTTCEMLVFQFMRNNKPKPSNVMMDKREIRSGYIGLPCAIVRKSFAKANFTDTENADFLWIQQYAVDAEFVKFPIVYSERRNYGRAE